MHVPEQLWRYVTRKAIDTLAARFALPNTPHMQDWEWEVADAARIDEFLSAYLSGELDDDERFALMEILLQSFSELEADLASDPRWQSLLAQLELNIDLHAHSVWYWSQSNETDASAWFRITPFLREILARHQTRLERRPSAFAGS
jgi:hypothetical protein